MISKHVLLEDLKDREQNIIYPKGKVYLYIPNKLYSDMFKYDKSEIVKELHDCKVLELFYDRDPDLFSPSDYNFEWDKFMSEDLINLIKTTIEQEVKLAEETLKFYGDNK